MKNDIMMGYVNGMRPLLHIFVYNYDIKIIMKKYLNAIKKYNKIGKHAVTKEEIRLLKKVSSAPWYFNKIDELPNINRVFILDVYFRYRNKEIIKLLKNDGYFNDFKNVKKLIFKENIIDEELFEMLIDEDVAKLTNDKNETLLYYVNSVNCA